MYTLYYIQFLKHYKCFLTESLVKQFNKKKNPTPASVSLSCKQRISYNCRQGNPFDDYHNNQKQTSLYKLIKIIASSYREKGNPAFLCSQCKPHKVYRVEGKIIKNKIHKIRFLLRPQQKSHSQSCSKRKRTKSKRRKKNMMKKSKLFFRDIKGIDCLSLFCNMETSVSWFLGIRVELQKHFMQ